MVGLRQFHRELRQINRRGYKVDFQAWRHFFQWQASLGGGRTPIIDAQPWLTFAAINWLDSVLSSEMKIFEYGSGGSSLFFSRRVHEVVSVEHDPHWFAHLSHIMAELKCSNWRGILSTPEREEGRENVDPSDPFGYVSSDEEFYGFSFKRYVDSINEFKPGYFDLIVIDGRARPSCIAASRKRAKRWILIDNTDREYYLKDIKLGPFERIMHFAGPAPYIEGFIRTSVIERGSI